MNVEEKPLVSCVIPSYKRCDTVTRAIDSVLAQTYPNVEVCLVDDNVPGDEYSHKLQEAIRRYDRDSRVRYIPQEKHINGAVARNVGIAAANGKYVAFLDDDDEWLPEKVEKQIDYLERHPEISGTSCLYKFYCNGKETGKCSPYTGDNLQFKVLARQVAIYTSTFLCKKSVIEQAEGFNPELLRHQDLQMFTEFLNFGMIEPINEYLVILHTDSEINRPDANRLVNVKKAYFESVKETVEKYGKKEQRRIRNAHNYEIAFSALRQKKVFMTAKYVLKSGIDIASIRDLWNRLKSR